MTAAVAYDTLELLDDPLPDGLERCYLNDRPDELDSDWPNGDRQGPADRPTVPRHGGAIRGGELFVDGSRKGTVVLVIECGDHTAAAGPLFWWEVVYQPTDGGHA